MSTKTLLFIPVSSLEGIGEYARSLIIAKSCLDKWPSLKIYFVLNKDVKYADSCPFEVLKTHGSPTKDSDAVDNILEKIKPDFVLFDASGRAANFHKAKAVGAKVAFISQHKKKRDRGLKLNRILSVDQHWVVQPDFLIEPLSLYQRCKLKLLAKHQPKNIGPVFNSRSNSDIESILGKYSLPQTFFLFNVGSGGHKKSKEYCVEKVYQAAKVFARQSGIHCIVILGENYPGILPSNNDVTCIQSLEHDEFIALLVMAKGRLVSAGDTVLQCIALLLPSVAVAVSSDQPKRLKTCTSLGLVFDSQFNIDEMVSSCQKLLLSVNAEKLERKMTEHQMNDALSIIHNDIALLLNLPNVID